MCNRFRRISDGCRSLAGPLFDWEIRRASRQPLHWISRIAYPSSLLLVVVLLSWKFPASLGAIGGPRTALVGAAMFFAAGVIQCAAVFFLIPSLISDAVTGMRERKTGEALLTTRLSDAGIVFGILAGRLFAAWAIILCMFPLFIFLVGLDVISIERLLFLEAATLLLSIVMGSLSIYFSATSQRSTGASLKALVSGFCWLSLPSLVTHALGYPAAWAMIAALPAEGWERFFWTQALVNPLFLLLAVCDPDFRHLGVGVFLAGVPGPLVLAGILTWRTAASLRGALSGEGVGLGRRLDQVLKRFHPWAQRMNTAAGWQPERTWWRRPVENPIWLGQRLVYRHGYSGAVLLRWFGGSIWLVGSLTLVWVALSDRSWLLTGQNAEEVLTAAWGFLAIMTCTASAHVLGDHPLFDRSHVALAAPLDSREWVDGLVLAVVETIRPFVWLPASVTVLLWSVGASYPLGLLVAAAIAGLLCLSLAVTGIACSCVASSQNEAASMALTLPGAMYAAVFVIRSAPGPYVSVVVWVLAGSLFASTRVWVGRRRSALAVGCHLTAGHLALIAISTSWTTFLHAGIPLAAIQPHTWLMLFPQNHYQDLWATAAPVALSYAAGLLASFLWARWWLIRHFDSLVGRLPSTFGRSSHAWDEK